ncbi:type III polyketide synthase [Streptomyces kebangsaanensis]|uniref:Type III polyketide synthase n=1 Tax=Streptomyces kebangsaanensis TaxID=864058 RepID=A0ABW6L1Y4_9ACTN
MRVPVIVDDVPLPPPTVPRPASLPGTASTIAAVRTALPPHRYAQDDLTEAIGDLCLAPGADRAVLRRLHASAGVRTRHLALPIERYAGLGDFGRSNDAWVAAGLELGEEALTGALREAGLGPADVDLLVCTSITGIAAPSLDARLAGRLGLRPDVKRLPVFGLGCAAGAAGLARLHDYLRGHPDDTAVLLSVELCSLTLQRRDDSRANLVAGALFGDGAAALVARGGGRAGPGAGGPSVVATRSRLYPGTEQLLGWDIGASGFRVVIDAGVPGIVRDRFGRHLRAFLAEHGLTTDDIGTWVCHPGGPKVLSAVADALGLPGDALDTARHSLATVGNLSSASVLHILQTVRESHRPEPGTWGLVLAMGPGFCSELVLLRW